MREALSRPPTPTEAHMRHREVTSARSHAAEWQSLGHNPDSHVSGVCALLLLCRCSDIELILQVVLIKGYRSSLPFEEEDGVGKIENESENGKDRVGQKSEMRCGDVIRVWPGPGVLGTGKGMIQETSSQDSVTMIRELTG